MKKVVNEMFYIFLALNLRSLKLQHISIQISYISSAQWPQVLCMDQQRSREWLLPPRFLFCFVWGWVG